MDQRAIAAQIEAGEGVLGIELGSTRIKAVLLGRDHTVLASGSFQWENRLEQGLWTYHLDDAVAGLRGSLAPFSAIQQFVSLRQSIHRIAFHLHFGAQWSLS